MISRRRFLATLTAAGLGTAGSGWLADRLFALVQENVLPQPSGIGVERWVSTVCALCPAGCGLRTRLVDGVPVGLFGNPLNPASGGGLCPAGHSGLWDMLGEDRIRTPLRRRGERGSGEWDAITWEEALSTLVQRLRDLRTQGTPERFLVLENGEDQVRTGWIDRVLAGFGSPNRCVPENPAGIWHTALNRALGDHGADLVPDLARTGGILSFGYELFDTDGHPVWQSKVWGRLRAPDRDRFPPLVYVGPRRSPSACKADLWLACRPGTEGTVALGIAYALFQEHLVSESVVRSAPEDVTGIELWLRNNFYPEAVQAVSGVAPDLLFRTARAMGQAASLALIGSAPILGPAGEAACQAVVLLNALLGAVGREGGWVASPAAPIDLPSLTPLDAIAARGFRAGPLDGSGQPGSLRPAPGRLWRNLSEGGVYPVDTILITGHNPLRELPDPEMVGAALKRAGLLVVVAGRLNETTALADIVLPESTFLESWGLHISRGLPLSVVSLRRPAFAPLYESRQFEDVWFDIARRLGSPTSDLVPPDYPDWIRGAVQGLYESGRGVVPDRPDDLRVTDFLEGGGWSPRSPGESYADFWSRFEASGVWYGPMARAAKEPSPSRQEGLSFFTPRARETMQALSRNAESGEPEETPGTNGAPLRLLIADSNALWKGRTAHTPLMLEMASIRYGRGWETVCEMNPRTARRMNLDDGAAAVLKGNGRVIAVRVRTTETVPLSTVSVQRGLSGHAREEGASRQQGNPMELVPFRVDESTGTWILAAQVTVDTEKGRQS